ncbi:hypothetical protein Vretimale_16760, partial [Volvox reticuliferus]
PEAGPQRLQELLRRVGRRHRSSARLGASTGLRHLVRAVEDAITGALTGDASVAAAMAALTLTVTPPQGPANGDGIAAGNTAETLTAAAVPESVAGGAAAAAAAVADLGSAAAMVRPPSTALVSAEIASAAGNGDSGSGGSVREFGLVKVPATVAGATAAQSPSAVDNGGSEQHNLNQQHPPQKQQPQHQEPPLVGDSAQRPRQRKTSKAPKAKNSTAAVATAVEAPVTARLAVVPGTSSPVGAAGSLTRRELDGGVPGASGSGGRGAAAATATEVPGSSGGGGSAGAAAASAARQQEIFLLQLLASQPGGLQALQSLLAPAAAAAAAAVRQQPPVALARVEAAGALSGRGATGERVEHDAATEGPLSHQYSPTGRLAAVVEHKHGEGSAGYLYQRSDRGSSGLPAEAVPLHAQTSPRMRIRPLLQVQPLAAQVPTVVTVPLVQPPAQVLAQRQQQLVYSFQQQQQQLLQMHLSTAVAQRILPQQQQQQQRQLNPLALDVNQEHQGRLVSQLLQQPHPHPAPAPQHQHQQLQDGHRMGETYEDISGVPERAGPRPNRNGPSVASPELSQQHVLQQPSFQQKYRAMVDVALEAFQNFASDNLLSYARVLMGQVVEPTMQQTVLGWVQKIVALPDSESREEALRTMVKELELQLPQPPAQQQQKRR